MEDCGWDEGSVGGKSEGIERAGRQRNFVSSLNLFLTNGGGERGGWRKDELSCGDDWAR